MGGGWFYEPGETCRIMYRRAEAKELLGLIEKDDVIYLSNYKDGDKLKYQFEEIMINAEKIAAEIKNTTSDKRQQAELLTVILNKKIKYGHKSVAAVYTALVKNEAVCEGYARSYNLVADLLDIPCICVDGVNKSSNESHAWNEEYIDGEWYVCDATLGVTLGSLNLSNYSTNLIRDDEYLEDKDMIKLTYNFEN